MLPSADGIRSHPHSTAFDDASSAPRPKEQSVYKGWEEGFETRMTSAGGWAGVLGNSLVMRLIGAPARSGIDRAVSRLGLGRQPVFLLSTGLFSAAISGAMVLIQRMRQPEAAREQFVDQWLQSTLYSLPAMLLGGWALQQYRFGYTFKQDLLMEPAQAVVSVMVAGAQGAFGGVSTLGMTVWERFKMELGEGLSYLAGGRPIGAIHSAVSTAGHRLGTTLDYLAGQTPGQLAAQAATFRNPVFASEIGAVGSWQGRRGRIGRRNEEPAPEALVWENENMTTSLVRGPDGRTMLKMKKVPLRNLKPGATALDGKFIHVTGEEPWERGKLYEPTVDPKGRVKLPDGLVQVVCYNTVDRLCQRFEDIGYDMLRILGSIHGDRPHSLRIWVNDFDEVNAFYDPRNDEIRFGKRVGADGDVPPHETVHGIGYHINVRLLRALLVGKMGAVQMGAEGGAIHEGMSDAVAAIFHNNPAMGEDIGRLVGLETELRNLDHDLAIKDVGDEVHDRGMVYGGFFWSLYHRLRSHPKIGVPKAQDLMFQIILNHIGSYATTRPSPADFVEAVKRGTGALERAGVLPIPIEDLTRMIDDEATKRGFLAGPEPQPKPPENGGDDLDASLRHVDRGVRRTFAGRHQVRFRRLATVPLLGGKTVHFKQQYQTKRQGKVDVIGRGMTQWYDRRGRPIEVSTRDVRRFQEGEIKEELMVDFPDALSLARRRLIAEMTRIEEEIESLKVAARRGPSKREKARQKRRAEIELQILKMCDAFAKPEREYARTLVILGDDPDLSYAIDLGFATFYVPTGTAKPTTDSVKFHSNVLMS